jgi:recombinational DNA repair ATPase RecF
LDDIFDKLDKYRTHKLLEQLQNFNLTQIFITDTDADRIASDQVNNLIVL